MEVTDGEHVTHRPLKTYSHLANDKRIPSEYEIATSLLHYYPEKGFEVQTPLVTWYQQYQRGSPFECSNWELFKDPRETTYSSYTALQNTQETQVEGILRSMEEPAYVETLSTEWIESLELLLPPLRYVGHALQMVSAYVGQMAPSGRVTIACAFQAADEVRRIQRIAYRMALLRRTHPQFGQTNKAIWEKHPAWQPLRQCMERLWVAYDWGEAFVALNLAVKPLVDDLFMAELPLLARFRGDYPLAQMLHALNEDNQWHRVWAGRLTQVVLDNNPNAKAPVREWLVRWKTDAVSAIQGVLPLLGTEGGAAGARVETRAQAYWANLGLK